MMANPRRETWDSYSLINGLLHAFPVFHLLQVGLYSGANQFSSHGDLYGVASQAFLGCSSGYSPPSAKTDSLFDNLVIKMKMFNFLSLSYHTMSIATVGNIRLRSNMYKKVDKQLIKSQSRNNDCTHAPYNYEDSLASNLLHNPPLLPPSPLSNIRISNSNKK